MGGNKGGGVRTPSVEKISLESAQRLKIVDLICEGVKRMDNKAAAVAVADENIYLDGTPLKNADGTYNFEGVEVYALPGTEDQDYLSGFDSSDTVVGVGAEVKHGQPITRTISDPVIDRIRVTLGVGGLQEIKDNGDTVGRAVSLLVSARNGAQVVSQRVTIKGRANTTYHRDVVLDHLPPAPFNLTVYRVTEDSTSDRVQDKTHWVSYVESIDAKLSYPDSVVVGLKIDSAQFGGRVPRRTYRSDWTVIEVPTNYNPDTRQYDGVWDGYFKRAWSNNPAWIYRDLVTNPRYGLARFRDDVTVDKWALYAIAKYCDELVDDGMGGQEPRFVCNAYITQPRDAYDVLSDLASCFRGITYFDGQNQVAVQDTPREPVAIYSNANVVDGMFEYSGVGYKDIITACIVKFADAENGYLADSVQYQDDAAIARFGYNVKTMTAFGCTSRGQAQRVARWYVETSIRERETVQFKAGREGIRHNPYDIIRIADNDYAGAQLGARIVSVSGNKLTLDREIDGNVTRVNYLDSTGKERYRSVNAAGGNQLTLSSAPTNIIENGVVAIVREDLAPRLFRAMGVTENDDGTYTIVAIAHDPNKEAIVDAGAEPVPQLHTTRHGKPQVYAPRVRKDGRDLTLTWDAIAADAVSYQVKLYRNGELHKTYNSETPSIDVSNLPLGDYRAEIRARDKDGGLSDAVEQAWSINYDITAFRATPRVLAVDFDWGVPANIVNDAWIELWYAATDDVTDATRLARLPYPASQFTMQNVNLHEQWYVWARIMDSNGNTGAWTDSVLAQPTTDPDPILQQIGGAISSSELSQNLIAQLAANDSQAAANAVASEAAARAQAIAAEAQARMNAINAQAAQQTAALNQKAAQLGNQISAVESVNDSQAQQISTLTTASDNNTAAIETERQARIAADNAEAAARNTLATQVAGNQSSINQLSQTVSNNQSATATQINNLSSRIDAQNLVDNSTNVRGKYLDKDAGGLLDWHNHSVTQYISVSAQKYYNVSTRNGQDAVNIRFVFYDADKNYLTGDIYSGYSSDHVLLSPTNAAFVRLSAYIDNCDGFVLSADLAADKVAQSAASDLNSYKQTQASVDAAQTEEINSAKSRIGNAESSINQLSQTVSNNQSTTATQINTLQSSVAQKIDAPTPTVVDLTGLNLNTWYPVVTSALPTVQPTSLRVSVELDDNTHVVPWSSHSTKKSFSLICEWTTNGRGWGRIFIERNIHKFTFAWVSDDKSPIIKIGQLGNSSQEYFLLRGGARYNVHTPANISVALHSGGFSQHGQSINPQGYDAALVPKTDIADIQATVSETQQTLATLDGKVSATYSIKTEVVSGGRTAMAGIAIGAGGDATSVESSVIVMADKFSVVKNAGDGSPKPIFSVVNGNVGINGNLIANGTILGQHIKANQTINAPNISGGSLSIGGKFSVNSAGKLTATDAVISGTVNATNGVFKGRIEATDGFFGGTVYVDKLEGDVSELLDFQPLAKRQRVRSYTAGYTTFIWVRTHILQVDPAPHPRLLIFLGEYRGTVRDKYYEIAGNRYDVEITLEDDKRVDLGLHMVPPVVYKLPAGKAKIFYLVTSTIAGTRYYDAMRDPPPDLNAHALVFNK